MLSALVLPFEVFPSMTKLHLFLSPPTAFVIFGDPMFKKLQLISLFFGIRTDLTPYSAACGYQDCLYLFNPVRPVDVYKKKKKSLQTTRGQAF